MNYSSCPISADLINTKLTRIYSIITFLAISIYLFTPFKEVIYISASDFIIRVLFGIKYSPICYLIKNGLKISRVKIHMVNAGPKKFAAKVGLVFTVLMSIGIILNFKILSSVLGTISFIAIGAEAFFGFCIACYIYSFIPNIWKK